MAEETVNINPDGSTTFEGDAAGGGEESTMPPVEGADPGMDEETVQEIVKGTDPAIYLFLAALLIGFLYFLYTRKARADAEDEFFANLEDEKVRPCFSWWREVAFGGVFVVDVGFHSLVCFSFFVLRSIVQTRTARGGGRVLCRQREVHQGWMEAWFGEYFDLSPRPFLLLPMLRVILGRLDR